VPTGDLKLIAGRANRPLAEKIARYVGVDLVDVYITEFADGEIFVKMRIFGEQMFLSSNLLRILGTKI
jgi:ribose-phosphate pyrophosphokinase